MYMSTSLYIAYIHMYTVIQRNDGKYHLSCTWKYFQVIAFLLVPFLFIYINILFSYYFLFFFFPHTPSTTCCVYIVCANFLCISPSSSSIHYSTPNAVAALENNMSMYIHTCNNNNKE